MNPSQECPFLESFSLISLDKAWTRPWATFLTLCYPDLRQVLGYQLPNQIFILFLQKGHDILYFIIDLTSSCSVFFPFFILLMVLSSFVTFSYFFQLNLGHKFNFLHKENIFIHGFALTHLKCSIFHTQTDVVIKPWFYGHQLWLGQMLANW